ncbi:MAG: hypothetical protein HY360_15445 [Verrucomicrobia bacterium]|nr:hypothetical protein [Verrucomicrobiota bacterium]
MLKISPATTPNARIIHAMDAELLLRVHCKTGYQCAFLRMRPGVFDAGTLDIKMDEFPSGRTVLTQGWDLHQFEKRMAVPTFTAFLNGRDLGDVWFDVPNYLDHRRGVLDTEFGFHADADGEVKLRLVIIPSDRKRFRWDMVECLEIAPDDRKEALLSPRKGLRRDRPWLFLNGRSVGEVRTEFLRKKEFKPTLEHVEQIVCDYDGIPPENRNLTKKQNPAKKSPPPYMPIDQVTAGAALATGTKGWIELARATLRRLCLMPTWCRDNHPSRLMGGENDMVIGHPMLSTCMLYHYLRDTLSREERAMAVAKAREYGRKLYDFSVLQKRYATGMGHISSHESGTLLGLGVAAMVFWDEIPEARRWLAWTHGCMLAGARAGPRDGRHPWSTYGPNFLTFYACAVRDFAGEDMFGIPFLRNLVSALLRSAQPGQLEHDWNMRWIMAAFAAYRGMPAAAWAWHHLWELQSRKLGGEHFIGWQDMLWHPRQPGRKPGSSFHKSHLFKDTGVALMRTSDDPASLCCFYQSGFAFGQATDLTQRRRFGMEQHDAQADGGVSIFVKGVPITAPAPSQYRRGFPIQSVVTVNGGGHYMDGRVLGVRPKEEWLSRMLSFRDTARKTVAVGDNTGAYREELGVLRSRRRVTLMKFSPELVVEDSISLRQPQQIAARFQCTGRIENLSAGRYRFHAANGERLNVFVHSPDRYRIGIRQSQMVLPYSYGFNVKKGKRTQPVTVQTPPRPQFLEIAAPGRAKWASFRVRFQIKAQAGRDGAVAGYRRSFRIARDTNFHPLSRMPGELKSVRLFVVEERAAAPTQELVGGAQAGGGKESHPRRRRPVA